LSEVNASLKLLQKEFEFTKKDNQTTISHLRLENEKLREQLHIEKDRALNELQMAVEDRADKEENTIKEMEQRFMQQISDIKYIHLTEKSKLQEDYDRVRSELKFLKIEHSELISNTNVGD